MHKKQLERQRKHLYFYKPAAHCHIYQCNHHVETLKKHPDQNSRENHNIVLLHQQPRQSATFKQITSSINSVVPAAIHQTLAKLTDIFSREHAVTDKERAIYKHLRTCEHLAFIQNLLNLPDTLNNITTPTISGNNEYAINVVQNNTTVLDYDDN